MRIELNGFRKRRINKWMKRADWHWKFAFCKKVGQRKYLILEWYGARYPRDEIYWHVMVEGEKSYKLKTHNEAMRAIEHGEKIIGKGEYRNAWIDDVASLTRNINLDHIEFCFKEDLATDCNGNLYNIQEAVDQLDGKDEPTRKRNFDYAGDLLNRLENQ